MRKLLIFLFLILTAVLMFYGWLEFAGNQTMAGPPQPHTHSEGVDGSNDLVGSANGGPLGQAQPMRSTAAPTPPVAIRETTAQLRNETFGLADETVDAKRTYAKDLVSYAHAFGWAGSICSWLILAITVFLQNAAPAKTKDDASSKKMSPKSGMVGLLAVGAAVCPLTAGKIEDDAIKYHTQIEAILEEVTELQMKGSQLNDEEWLAELRHLKNTILR